eukprot:scaffold7738_cov107-Isochrysis_galbana.AAC.4
MVGRAAAATAAVATRVEGWGSEGEHSGGRTGEFLAVEHPLQRLRLEGVQLHQQARGRRRSRISSRLHRPHQPRQRESKRGSLSSSQSEARGRLRAGDDGCGRDHVLHHQPDVVVRSDVKELRAEPEVQPRLAVLVLDKLPRELLLPVHTNQLRQPVVAVVERGEPLERPEQRDGLGAVCLALDQARGQPAHHRVDLVVREEVARGEVTLFGQHLRRVGGAQAEQDVARVHGCLGAVGSEAVPAAVAAVGGLQHVSPLVSAFLGQLGVFSSPGWERAGRLVGGRAS